jgi:hypothetical protein
MTIYYHGGMLGLRVGQHILPPAETGSWTVADLRDAPAEMRDQLAAVHRRDRVYLTTDVAVARLWAGLHPTGGPKRGGDVYRVEPEGDIEPDPDYLGDDGASVQAPSALIVGIVATGVSRAPYRHLIEEANDG